MADISSCWCLCGGDSGVGVAAGSFSIAVDESVPEDQPSYRAIWIHLQATERLGAGSMCLTRLGEGDAGGEGASLSTAGV